MKITELFDKGEFVITNEVGPVKGCHRSNNRNDLPPCVREAEIVRHCTHAINVTDNQSAAMRLGSLAASVALKKQGFEPIYQLTCRDRNRIALQSDLLSACSLGINNALCLTGDHTSLGDHKTAKSVFDIDSVQLLKIASGLNQGYDMMGNSLTQPTDIALGAVVNPNFDPLDLQLLKMEKKIEAGARFFQTQTVYDPAIFETMIKKTQGFGVPIQYGIVIVKSPKMGKYMNENVSGINVPDWIIQEMGSVSKKHRKNKATEITLKLVKEIGPMAQGIHFMPLGWSDIVPDIVKALNESISEYG